MALVICAQRQSILDEAGPILVTGGPGCGKTTIALALVEALGSESIAYFHIDAMAIKSADLVDDASAPIECNLALACVAGWTSTRDYPERLVRALSPNHVLLSHWDNFFRPAAAGVRALPTMKLEQLTDRLARAQGQDARIGALEIGASLTL